MVMRVLPEKKGKGRVGREDWGGGGLEIDITGAITQKLINGFTKYSDNMVMIYRTNRDKKNSSKNLFKKVKNIYSQ